ncbi:TetR/AcrR family transcriptional regulator [Kitasatospora sp. NBC_01250]|uniref:TetR/AcrR family transcriptional regulator n=1 Tax=unclassified Kitasatospora TaxID=2633591 RepID=UPI002E11639A|nr:MULTISPECIES: TetR/AcrR family transcriptional regulator [unclassified Kitasatospora]WSJ71364.1 TetR/AcrR family transcriptional regulator [Kitasatospora sp. NBC_01302]
MQDEDVKPPVRRARVTPAREADLLSAALEVLREVGYEAMTMDAVALRGRCSKATLYKVWQGKPQLVAAALQETRPVDLEIIDTGTLKGDLLALVRQLADSAQENTALMTALSHAALADRGLAEALRERLVGPEIGRLHALVERAVHRGELPALPGALAFLPQMLFAVLLSRPLFEDAFADADYLTSYVETALLPALLHS